MLPLIITGQALKIYTKSLHHNSGLSPYNIYEVISSSENYITFRRMSNGCHLMVQHQKHAKISCGKVQFTNIYKLTLPIFIDTYCWNLINIIL